VRWLRVWLRLRLRRWRTWQGRWLISGGRPCGAVCRRADRCALLLQRQQVQWRRWRRCWWRWRRQQLFLPPLSLLLLLLLLPPLPLLPLTLVLALLLSPPLPLLFALPPQLLLLLQPPLPRRRPQRRRPRLQLHQQLRTPWLAHAARQAHRTRRRHRRHRRQGPRFLGKGRAAEVAAKARPLLFRAW
jgi:hypothetical protein